MLNQVSFLPHSDRHSAGPRVCRAPPAPSLSPHGCVDWGSGGQSGGASSWYWTLVEVKAALRPVPGFQKKRNEKEGKAELTGVFRLLAVSRSTRGKRRGVAGDPALFLVTALSLPFLCTPVSVR